MAKKTHNHICVILCQGKGEDYRLDVALIVVIICNTIENYYVAMSHMSYTESNLREFVSGPSNETNTFFLPPHHQPKLFNLVLTISHADEKLGCKKHHFNIHQIVHTMVN